MSSPLRGGWIARTVRSRTTPVERAMMFGTVLLVDQEIASRDRVAGSLRDDGFRVIECADGIVAMETLEVEDVEVLVTELVIPGASGLALIQRARELRPEATVIVAISINQVEAAVDAVNAGATHCLRKPIDVDQLRRTLEHRLVRPGRANHNGLLRKCLFRPSGSTEIVGKSSKKAALLGAVQGVAGSRAHVLICGAPGTGKSVLSRAIVAAGGLGSERFYGHNCEARSEAVLQNCLFRDEASPGSEASPNPVSHNTLPLGATLALYDVGRLDSGAQAVLLRAISNRETAKIPGNALQIIATTSRDLSEAVVAGKFHAALLNRLSVRRIDVPLLRERREDIPDLTAYFLRGFKAELNRDCPGFTSGALDALSGLPWHGNITELKNAVERVVILCENEEIDVAHLPRFMDMAPNVRTSRMPLREATHVFERGYILGVLERLGYDKVAAAKALGLGLSSLYRKLEAFDIPRNQSAGTAKAEHEKT